MKLAKNHIDIGVRTNNLDAMLDFWQNRVGLPYEELLKIGGGVHQHRLGLNGSVFKLNHARDALQDTPPSGYHELLIASKVTEPEHLTDPDGNRVTLVPEGFNDISHIGMVMKVRSLKEAEHFYRDVLQAEDIGNHRYRWATTVFILEEDTTRPASGGMQGGGYRYITVQVYKVDSEHADALDRGAREGAAPVTLGSTARISFITDPDGNWIEVSQRASLTGDLSPG